MLRTEAVTGDAEGMACVEPGLSTVASCGDRARGAIFGVGIAELRDHLGAWC